MADFSDIMADPRPPAAVPVSIPSAPYAVTGTTLRVSIIAESWDKPGTMETLNCGTFEIDGISLDYGDSGSTATIKGVSVPLQSSIRREEKSRGWEAVTLKQIALDIAQTGGLSLLYELDKDFSIGRADQRKQSDLSFLQDIARKLGAAVKVTDNQLILFDEAKYELKPAVYIFKRGDKRLISASFTQDSSHVANSAEMTYKDPATGKLVTANYTPVNAPGVGSSVSITDRPVGM